MIRDDSSRTKASSRHFVFGFESIPDAGFGMDEPWPNGICFDLSSQMADIDAEILLRISDSIPPDLMKELLMRERLPGMMDQGPQQCPLGGSEVHGRAIALHAAPLLIDDDVSERDHVRRAILPNV